MQEVKKWLEDEQRDYSIGLGLLGKYSKNRILIQNLSRKERPSKLIYELEKICLRNKVVVATKKDVIIPPVVDDNTTPLHLDAVQTLIKTKSIIRCSELPDHLQVIWKENQEKYKQMRAFHEKAKLVQTAEDRIPLLNDIETLRKAIFKNWEYLDKYVAEKNGGSKNEGNPPVIDEKKIKANRKYISEGLTKLDKLHGVAKAQKIEGIQRRVNELLSVEAKFTPDYKEKLKAIGISFNE